MLFHTIVIITLDTFAGGRCKFFLTDDRPPKFCIVRSLVILLPIVHETNACVSQYC